MAYEARCEHRRIGVLTRLEAVTGVITTLFGPTLGCLDCGVAIFLERQPGNMWTAREDERGKRD